MKLKIKDQPNIQYQVQSNNSFITVIVRSKLVFSEYYKEIRIGTSCGKMAEYKYMGTITYIASSLQPNQYALSIAMEDTTCLVATMKLFFKKAKGIFCITPCKETAPIDRLLVNDLSFIYKGGVYTYKSL